MAKIDFERYTLPDIEMYAGNTDVWEFRLYNSGALPYEYRDVNGYSYQLIIKDFAYRREEGQSNVSIIKSGELVKDDDGTAFVRFEFMKSETNELYGKFIYQFEAIGQGKFFSAQGSLYITKNINQ